MNNLSRVIKFFNRPIKMMWLVLFMMVTAYQFLGAIVDTLDWSLASVLQIIKSPRIETVVDQVDELRSHGDDVDPDLNCSDLKNQWQPGENTYFENNKIKLQDVTAGAVFLKNKVSSFVSLELEFKSSISTGINTNISFENDDGELRYSIGDGDFRTIRYFYLSGGKITNRRRTILPLDIDNRNNLGFKIDIIEQGKINKAISSFKNGDEPAVNLDDVIIPNPKKIHIKVGFGFNAGESNNKEAYIELVTCKIKESPPSKILDQ